MEEFRKVLKDCYDDSCASYKNGETEGVTKYYAEDTFLLWPGFKLGKGKEALEKNLKILMSLPTPTNFQFVTHEVIMMSEDKAIERGSFTVTTDDGKLFNSGKTLIIWKKVQGEWLIEVDSFNNNTLIPGNQ